MRFALANCTYAISKSILNDYVPKVGAHIAEHKAMQLVLSSCLQQESHRSCQMHDYHMHEKTSATQGYVFHEPFCKCSQGGMHAEIPCTMEQRGEHLASWVVWQCHPGGLYHRQIQLCGCLRGDSGCAAGQQSGAPLPAPALLCFFLFYECLCLPSLTHPACAGTTASLAVHYMIAAFAGAAAASAWLYCLFTSCS